MSSSEEAVDPGVVPQRWEQRTITLLHDRVATERICLGWAEAGWQIMTIDTAPPTPQGHQAHVVRVAVPPPDWPALDDTGSARLP